MGLLNSGWANSSNSVSAFIQEFLGTNLIEFNRLVL